MTRPNKLILEIIFMRLIGIVLLMAVLFSGCAEPERESLSNSKFQYILMNYYRSKNLELIDLSIVHFARNGWSGHINGMLPAMMFFSCAFHDARPGDWLRWKSLVEYYSGPGQHALLMAVYAKPQEILDRQPYSPMKNDLNWSCYNATGKKQYLNDIANTLMYADADDDLHFLTAASAKWSLASRAESDQTVKSLIRSISESSVPELREHGLDMLHMTPEQIREKSYEQFRLRKKGVQGGS
jgi:hypothetical protein